MGLRKRTTIALMAGLVCSSDVRGNPVEFEGHHYQLTSAEMSWQDAEAEAVALGGHLVSINRYEEHVFVMNAFIVGALQERPVWIGLSDQAVEGIFEWSSQEPVEFAFWAEGEPNNVPPFGEDYVAMNWEWAAYDEEVIPGDWNDTPLEGTPHLPEAFDPKADGPYFGIIEIDLCAGEVPVIPQNIVDGHGCSERTAYSPLACWEDEDQPSNAFDLSCTNGEFLLRYNSAAGVCGMTGGLEVGRCSFRYGRNRAEIFAPGDPGPDMKYDCFDRSHWLNREPLPCEDCVGRLCGEVAGDQRCEGWQDYNDYEYVPDSGRPASKREMVGPWCSPFEATVEIDNGKCPPPPANPMALCPAPGVSCQPPRNPTLPRVDALGGISEMVADPFDSCDTDFDGDCDQVDFDLLGASVDHCLGETEYYFLSDRDRDNCVTRAEVQVAYPALDFDGDGVVNVLDNCPSASDPLLVDADLDGHGDACDCAPLDLLAFGMPREIRDVRMDGNLVLWRSDAAHSGPVTTYEILRGSIHQLPVGTGVDEVCGFTVSTHLVDDEFPAVGTGFYYLLRGSNSCATGTFGTTSLGDERLTAACSAPAGLSSAVPRRGDRRAGDASATPAEPYENPAIH